MSAAAAIPEALRTIVQSAIPARPWADPGLNRLPGTVPIDADDWIRADEAFAPQMALRDHLIGTCPGDVIRSLPEAEGAAAEFLGLLLDRLARSPGYRLAPGEVRRPDGRAVALGDPLPTVGRLIQEDVCLHLPDGDGHRLVAGVLCFPASWSLTEKLGRPLAGVHDPVQVYDAGLAARVERLFAALRPGRPLMRMNALSYADPCLFQPRRENDRRDRAVPPRFLRSERQCFVRLPRTGAVAFTIHTYVVPLEKLSPADRAALGRAGGAEDPQAG